VIIQRDGAPEWCELRAFAEVQESFVLIACTGATSAFSDVRLTSRASSSSGRLSIAACAPRPMRQRAMIDSRVWVALVACTAISIRMPDIRPRSVSSTITAPASSRSPHAPNRSRSIPDFADELTGHADGVIARLLAHRSIFCRRAPKGWS